MATQPNNAIPPFPIYHTVPVPPEFISSHDPDHTKVLWIGCSDSLVSETDVLAIPREDIFVHRNLGNVVSNGDLSSGSAIEWALEMLKVRFHKFSNPSGSDSYLCCFLFFDLVERDS